MGSQFSVLHCPCWPQPTLNKDTDLAILYIFNKNLFDGRFFRSPLIQSPRIDGDPPCPNASHKHQKTGLLNFHTQTQVRLRQTSCWIFFASFQPGNVKLWFFSPPGTSTEREAVSWSTFFTHRAKTIFPGLRDLRCPQATQDSWVSCQLLYHAREPLRQPEQISRTQKEMVFPCAASLGTVSREANRSASRKGLINSQGTFAPSSVYTE